MTLWGRAVEEVGHFGRVAVALGVDDEARVEGAAGVAGVADDRGVALGKGGDAVDRVGGGLQAAGVAAVAHHQQAALPVGGQCQLEMRGPVGQVVAMGGDGAFDAAIGGVTGGGGDRRGGCDGDAWDLERG